MINKAVITAAGKGTRQYPATNAVQKEMFPLIDLDGIAKPTIQIIAEQAVTAGIQEICIVVNPGEAEQFQRHFSGFVDDERMAFESKGKVWGLRQSENLDDLKQRITYVEQTEQHGFGHAVWCAHDFVADDAFLLLLGDHVYVSDTKIPCIQQALQGFDRAGKTLFPVIRTPIEQLHLFGTLTGNPVQGENGLYEVTEIIEKPDPETARKHLQTYGLPENEFLTFFGMYAMSPMIMKILDRHVLENVRFDGEIQFAPALKELTEIEGAFALEIQGQRLDMGTPFGYIETVIALAKRGVFGDCVDRLI